MAVIAGNLVGGPWVLAGIVYMLGVGPVLDLVFGRADRPRPPRPSGRPFEIGDKLVCDSVFYLDIFARADVSPHVGLEQGGD